MRTLAPTMKDGAAGLRQCGTSVGMEYC